MSLTKEIKHRRKASILAFVKQFEPNVLVENNNKKASPESFTQIVCYKTGESVVDSLTKLCITKFTIYVLDYRSFIVTNITPSQKR